jgi:hypothetical protein
VVKDLRQLLKFTAVDKVEVLLWGSGNRNECDLATQRKIREISGVVTEPIRQLGSKLRVIRRQQGMRISGSTHTRTNHLKMPSETILRRERNHARSYATPDSAVGAVCS